MKNTEQLKNLRIKTDKELGKLMKDKYQKLSQLKFAVKFRNIKNIQEIAHTKKNIARIWTVLSERNNQENK